MDDVGIEYQTVLGCPPVEFVHLAADLGCRAISMKASTGPALRVRPVQLSLRISKVSTTYQQAERLIWSALEDSWLSEKLCIGRAVPACVVLRWMHC